jgi:diguanylate cyclase (GGDEF)-like protein/PAS domain S-box-containing protein
MRFIKIILLLQFLFAGLISAAWGQENAHVLLLDSYNYGLDWTDAETNGVREVLEKSGRPVELHVEYMDTKRLSDETHFKNLLQLLEYKYRNTRFDAILVTDNDAFNFLRQYRNKPIFSGVPVVFCGVNFFHQEMLAGFKGFTGIAETFEGGQTVGLMQHLHPGIKRIVVVIDSTTTGLAIRKDLEPMLAPYAGQIDFEFWDKLSLEQMRANLPALDKSTLVLLMPFARDSLGQFIRYADMAEMVSRLSSVPVYGTYEFYMGYGIVGGRLTRGEAQGRAAAGMLLRVLDGEDPELIPVKTVAPSEFEFDSRQLTRHGIGTSGLPRSSKILFRSGYEAYQAWIWLGGLLFFIMLLLGWGWGRAYVLKRRSDVALSLSEEKLRTVFDYSSNAILLVRANGLFTFGNPQAELLLGYSGEELLQIKLKEILHPDEMERVMKAFKGILSGEHAFIETALVRKGGSRIVVEVNAVRLPGGEVLGELRDITKRKQSELLLQRGKDQLAAILNATTESIFRVDEKGIILDINDMAARRVRNTPRDMIGKCAFDYFPVEVSSSRRESLSEVFRSGKEKYTEDSRNDHFFSLNYYPIHDSDGKVGSVVVYAADITERKQSETEIRIAAIAFESQVGMFVTDTQGTILRVNQTFSEITGYSAEDVIGKNPKLLNSGRHDAQFYAEMWNEIKQTGGWKGEIWNRRKNGEAFPEHLTITAVKESNGHITNYVANLIDITASKVSEEEIRNLAFFDTLTKLPNRRLLQDRLQQALASSNRSGKEGAILFIDLDNFKTLNDTRGHDIGDMLLEQVALRLTTCVRTGDTVARLGGDEFVVMLEELSENILEAAEQTELVGKKILSTLNQTYHLGTHAHHSTPSIGATLFDKQKSTEELLKQADIAMYQAKNAGRNTLRFFDPGMQLSISARAALELELRKALDLRQFHLYYQIQVDHLLRPLGAEALIRWIHPERGMISPAEFIPMAEETGLIYPIGWWVLETACAQLKIWQNDERSSNLVLAVNVSAKQFHQADFADQVQAVVQHYGINPTLLKLELTESMLLDNIEVTIATMVALRQCGVKFSLDDFGTGYSSLQYLKRLPLDQLKIDQSFVRDIASDNNDKAIVSTIIAMAHGMNLDVIAEGVETEEQRQLLLNMDCLHFQGYLFSKPVAIEQFETLLGRGE